MDINGEIDYRKSVRFAAKRLVKDYGFLAMQRACDRMDAAPNQASAAFWEDVKVVLGEEQ